MSGPWSLRRIVTEKSHVAVNKNPQLEGSEGLAAQIHSRINTDPAHRDTSVKQLNTFDKGTR